jgi:hypothetical protein
MNCKILRSVSSSAVEPYTGYFQPLKLLHLPTLYPLPNKPFLPEKDDTGWEIPETEFFYQFPSPYLTITFCSSYVTIWGGCIWLSWALLWNIGLLYKSGERLDPLLCDHQFFENRLFSTE